MIGGGSSPGHGWRVVDARPGYVKVIRDWISCALTRHGCPVDPDDAVLAVGELFTNAVTHGPADGQVLVGYWLWSGGARLVVCDGGGAGTPQVCQVTDQTEGGRGLQVVDSITTRWGSFHSAGNLVVWCEFGHPRRVRSSTAWAWFHCVTAWAWFHCVLAGKTPRLAQGSRRGRAEPEPTEADPTVPVHAAASTAAGRPPRDTGLHTPAAPVAPLTAVAPDRRQA